MPKTSFTMDTPLDPDRVFQAYIDFTDRRPEIWPNISRKLYSIHAQGDNWAEVTEGSEKGKRTMWARERYEWSVSERIARSRVLESNWIYTPGPVEYRVEARDGGARIHYTMDRKRKGFAGSLFDLFLTVGGKGFMKTYWRKHLQLLEEGK